MALCEVDDPALIRDQVEAFLKTETPEERQGFTLFFGSFMQKQLRNIVGEGNRRRCIDSGTWLIKTVKGELFIQRQVITDPETGLPIIDPTTQLPIGRITRLTHRWTDDNLSLSITQEKRGSSLSPIILLTQIQVASTDQAVTFNPSQEQS